MSLVVSVWQQQLEDVRLLANALAPGQVRIVGGAVRDYLLGNAPHDIDLATPFLWIA